MPEPLQAIALKALERRPADRYPSAREMALDLQRYLDGRPVLAHPSQYASALSTRVKPHLDQIEDWQRLQAGVSARGRAAARPRTATSSAATTTGSARAACCRTRRSRCTSGAFLLMCGSLFYFGADQIYEKVAGVLEPTLVLGLPFVGLNLAAHRLGARGHRAVSVAFYLGGVSLLPLFLLILFHETHFLVGASRRRPASSSTTAGRRTGSCR